MRTTVITVSAVFACAAALAFAPAVHARPTTPAPHPAVATAQEPHPEINRAIAALERAKFHLQHAAHDFGGHRVAAIGAIDRALVQLRLALQFDKD